MATHEVTVSLELTNLMVPGFNGYTPPFGTKVADGTSLNPMQVQENMQMPYQTIGSILGVDMSALVTASSGDTVNISVPIERNATIKMLNCVSGVTYNVTLEGTGTMASEYLLFGIVTDDVGEFTVQGTSIEASSSALKYFMIDASAGGESISVTSLSL